mgnify:CR=1 FL=1
MNDVKSHLVARASQPDGKDILEDVSDAFKKLDPANGIGKIIDDLKSHLAARSAMPGKDILKEFTDALNKLDPLRDLAL